MAPFWGPSQRCPYHGISQLTIFTLICKAEAVLRDSDLVAAKGPFLRKLGGQV